MRAHVNIGMVALAAKARTICAMRRRHDGVLAEGVAIEIYLDNGSESVFQGRGSSIALCPDLASRLLGRQALRPTGRRSGD